MSRSRLPCFRCFTRPRSWNTFSCAFSRTEQVLKRIRSASSGRSVISKPFSARRSSAILSESYSFIWQPKVRMKSFFVMSSAAARPRELLGREQPDAKDLPAAIQDVIGPGPLARNAHRHDDEIALVADGRAGGELHRFAVHRYGRLHDMPEVAASGVLGNRHRARLGDGRRPQEGRQEREVRGAAYGHGRSARREMVANQGLEPRTCGL